MPSHAVQRAYVGKMSVHRIAVGDTAAKCPEREPIVECVRILIDELDAPSNAAVFGFIDAKICRVVSNGEQVGNLVVEGLNVAELEHFRARHYTGVPGVAAISGDGVGAI